MIFIREKKSGLEAFFKTLYIEVPPGVLAVKL
jgi:hypothetical protein